MDECVNGPDCPHMECIEARRMATRIVALETRLATLDAERAGEEQRRKFMQVSGRYMGWGFNSTEEMQSEGQAAAGVAVYYETAPYRTEKVFVRYSECGNDRDATEREAIDRAIKASTPTTPEASDGE